MDKLTAYRKAMAGQPVKDQVYSSRNEYANEEEAASAYVRATAKLYDVNKWSSLPGFSSKFQLYDQNGQQKNAVKPMVGDFIRILLPGPVPENWVVVTDISAEGNTAQFAVQPSQDPTDKSDQKIDHFFRGESKSIFKVELQGTTLSAFEIGKSEGANNRGEEAGDRKAINTLISAGGWAGFQQFQWTKLTDYLVHKIETTDTEL